MSVGDRELKGGRWNHISKTSIRLLHLNNAVGLSCQDNRVKKLTGLVESTLESYLEQIASHKTV
jgi:hypothetical protein